VAGLVAAARVGVRAAAREAAAKAAAMEVVARAVAVRAAPKAAVAQVMAMAAAVRVEVAWAAARAAAECFPTIAGRRGGGRGCEKGGSSLSYAKPSTSFRHDRQRQAGRRKSSSFLTSAIPLNTSLFTLTNFRVEAKRDSIPVRGSKRRPFDSYSRE
jgi:hypothetical protein